MRNKPSRQPDVNKASIYAIVVNGIQIAALALIVLYILLGLRADHIRSGLTIVASYPTTGIS